MCDLTGQSAVITGGAQGIGFGIAIEVARAGGRVAIADLNLQRATVAADEIRAMDREAIALHLDVTDAESVARCVQMCADRFNGIDILVNNAGIHCESIGRPSQVEHFSRCFEVNLFGAWRMSQAMVPHFRTRGRGNIVNIASINGRKPWADTPAYSASKAALINLTQSQALQLGKDNINVNAVCPGGVMTAMADSFAKDLPTMPDQIIRARALHRPLLPEDIGHAVVFLASPQAKSITGQALNVDGGTVMS
jgi:NAD(P)-dependent dehydrogenase (short-subunit alcohol dehydrogenase family)